MNINPLNANPEKWSNTLKQIVGNLPTICLSVFDHFMNLALKGLNLYRHNHCFCLFSGEKGSLNSFTIKGSAGKTLSTLS